MKLPAFNSLPRFAAIAGALMLVCVAFPTASLAESTRPQGRIFLTFDDGPIDASLNLLDVLKANGVRATFFVNGFRLTDKDEGEKLGRAAEAMRRMVAEGHVLGNHSFDHMRHNAPPGKHESPVDSYQDAVVDAGYFIPRNSEIINGALGDLKDRPGNAMLKIGRMPFSNNWVLPGLTVVCGCCTNDGVAPWHPDSKCGTKELPISNSARLGGETAKMLYREYGMVFFGWDVEWGPYNWDAEAISETLVPAEAVEQDILAILNGRKCTLKMLSGDASCETPTVRGKVIVLSHDFFFENSWRGRGADINLPKLDRLIKSLQAKGYVFDTLDRYLE